MGVGVEKDEDGGAAWEGQGVPFCGWWGREGGEAFQGRLQVGRVVCQLEENTDEDLTYDGRGRERWHVALALLLRALAMMIELSRR